MRREGCTEKGIYPAKTVQMLNKLYRKKSTQPEFEKFYMPFGGKLRSDNRWIIMAKFMPWDEVEQKYATKFNDCGIGAPAKNARVALGALMIKERLKTTDEETVEQVMENPYLQFFLGYDHYSDEQPFDPSMMVYFRKRFLLEDLTHFQEELKGKLAAMEKEDHEDKGSVGSRKGGGGGNQGKLLLDATVTPADIRFPTDMSLLNEAREKTEAVIDKLHAPLRGEEEKVRTHREKARKDYLEFAKAKKKSRRAVRRAIGKQIRYLRRNLKHIQDLSVRVPIRKLSRRQYRDLLVIQELYRQQELMYREKTHRIADRIVSISQPHVRPIVRGKAGAEVEFGAKISVSCVDGMCFVDRLSWNSYNEGQDLIGQIEKYRKRFGFYPESVHVDKIYRTRENREFCRANGIRITGPALGRPKENWESEQARREERRQRRKDELDRIPIEGQFGVSKRKYSLDCVKAKLAETSVTVIGVVFLVMGLERLLRALFCPLLITICEVSYCSYKPDSVAA
jgi:transposase, IS5 family